MPDPKDRRARLEELRARARMAELQAKRDGAPGGSKVIEMPVQEIQGDPGPVPGRLKNAADHAASGMTFGLADHAAAAGRALGSDMSYADALTHHRAQMERGRRAYPESTPMQLAGALASGRGISRGVAPGVAPQAAAGAGMGAVGGAAASDGDPMATAVGAGTGAALGGVGARLAGAPAPVPPARAAQAMVGRPGAAPAAAAGPGVMEAGREFAKQVAPAAAVGGGAKLLGANDRDAAIAAGLVAGGVQGAPQIARAGVPLAQALGRAGVAGAGAAAKAAPGLAGGGIGASPFPAAVTAALQAETGRRNRQVQSDGVRRAFVSGSLSPSLRAEVEQAVTSGDQKALAAKLHELQSDPKLAAEIERLTKGRRP